MKYNHYIEYDGITRKILIYRIYGEIEKKVLYTEINVPEHTERDRFFSELGEILCIDSEVMREFFKL